MKVKKDYINMPLTFEEIREIEDTMNPDLILKNKMDLCWQSRRAIELQEKLYSLRFRRPKGVSDESMSELWECVESALEDWHDTDQCPSTKTNAIIKIENALVRAQKKLDVMKTENKNE